VGLRGHEDDSLEQLRVVALDLLVELLPVHLGHAQVAEDQVVAVLPDEVEGFLAVLRGVDVVPLDAEGVRDQFAHRALVVDDQDAGSSHVASGDG
jgi:hypothetical protein